LLMSSDLLMLVVALDPLHWLVLLFLLLLFLFPLFIYNLGGNRVLSSSLGSDCYLAINGIYCPTVLYLVVIVCGVMSFERSIRSEIRAFELD
jgi:hypothetical protein